MIQVNLSYTIQGETPKEIDFDTPSSVYTDALVSYLVPKDNYSEPVIFSSSNTDVAVVELIDSIWTLNYIGVGSSYITATKGSESVSKTITVLSKPIGNIVNVGSGSGTLNISQSGLLNGDTVVIKAGNYSSINIQDLHDVRVISDGLVTITGGTSKWNNLTNVEVDGSVVDGIKYGIVFSTGPNTAIESDTINNSVFTNIGFRDISSYSAWLFNNEKTYTGSRDSYLADVTFRNLSLDNCTPLRFNGRLDTLNAIKLTGLLVDFKFIGLESHDCRESIAEIGCCHNVLIDRTIANNSNQSRENHAVLFMVSGNGVLRNSRVTNFYGNIIRLWGFTITDGIIATVPKLSKIYGNIGFCSRTYSAFELQNFANNRQSGFAVHTDLDVFNNTVGDLNLSLPVYFTGTLLDNYDKLGATIRAFNNILFNKHGDTANTPFFIWDAEPGEEFNNLYYNTSEESKVNLGNFTISNISEARGTAVNDSTLSDYDKDMYGNAFASNIGAIQRINYTLPSVVQNPTPPINDLHTQGSTYTPDKMLRARASKSEIGVKNYDVEINGSIMTTRGGYAHAGRENKNSTGAYNFPIGPLSVRYRARDFRDQVSEWSEMLNVIIE